VRFVKLKDCKPGMVLGKNIYGFHGMLLISRGKALSGHHIVKLGKLGYVGAYIDDEISKGIEVEEVIDPVIRNHATVAVEELFSVAKFSEKPAFAMLIKNVEHLLEEIVRDILSNRNSVVTIASLKTLDRFTYQHSVDVCTLSLILGRELKLSKKELLDLGRAALFHDVGKAFVPNEILTKHSRLTEEELEEMRKHPEYGYACLTKVLNQPREISEAVLYHHERYDGKGYPEGLAQDETPLYAQIIAVADVYDAITSKRDYREALFAAEAYEHIMSNMEARFSPKVVQAFTRKIAPFPVGVSVELSDGRQAIVVKNNQNFMMRPLVKIVSTEGSPPVVEERVDLANDESAMSITIVNIL